MSDFDYLAELHGIGRQFNYQRQVDKPCFICWKQFQFKDLFTFSDKVITSYKPISNKSPFPLAIVYIHTGITFCLDCKNKYSLKRLEELFNRAEYLFNESYDEQRRLMEISNKRFEVKRAKEKEAEKWRVIHQIKQDIRDEIHYAKYKPCDICRKDTERDGYRTCPNCRKEMWKVIYRDAEKGYEAPDCGSWYNE